MLIWNEANGLHQIGEGFKPNIVAIDTERPVSIIERAVETFYNNYLQTNNIPYVLYCMIESITPKIVYRLLLLADGITEPPLWSDKVNG